MISCEEDVRLGLWNFDNANIPKPVFSMRIDNQSRFHSVVVGCLWARWVKINMTKLRQKYEKTRREGSLEPFNVISVLEAAPHVRLRTRDHNIHHILRVVLDSPSFASYEHISDDILSSPPPVEALPFGPGHIPEPFVLRVEDIDQSSYEGNLKVLERYLQQLHADSPEEKKKTSTARFIPVIGDGLTWSRLLNLSKFRFADKNGFERLDWMLPLFGWFHLMMALAGNIHKQYLGTASGIGLRRAFDLLDRKGLQTQQTKGPFWHHLDEAIHHVFSSLIRAALLEQSGATDLNELTKLSATELHLLTEDVYDRLASPEALKRMRTRYDHEPDEFKEQTVMYTMDLLMYVNLRHAIKYGDVGRMEDALPSLLQRFAGGGNSQYTIAVLELIQGLQREWPPELR